MPTSVLIAVVAAVENIPPVAAHEEAETIHNMTTENKLYFQAEKEDIFLILTGYNKGEIGELTRVKTQSVWEFKKFTSRDGESMESYYSRFYKLMNELTRNNLQVSPMQVNVQNSIVHFLGSYKRTSTRRCGCTVSVGVRGDVILSGRVDAVGSIGIVCIVESFGRLYAMAIESYSIGRFIWGLCWVILIFSGIVGSD
ncbi:hypothetical protein Tco_0742765 [Tanacetum coccineum]